MERRQFLKAAVAAAAVVTPSLAAASKKAETTTTTSVYSTTTLRSSPSPRPPHKFSDPQFIGKHFIVDDEPPCEACIQSHPVTPHDLMVTSDEIAFDLLGLPEEEKDKALKELKDNCAVLHSLVIHKMGELRQFHIFKTGRQVPKSTSLPNVVIQHSRQEGKTDPELLHAMLSKHAYSDQQLQVKFDRIVLPRFTKEAQERLAKRARPLF